jgi:Tol biopolymer transport system component
MTHLMNTFTTRPRRIRPLLAALVALSIAVLALSTASSAEATFPGKNGRIAYVRTDGANHAIFIKSVSSGSDVVGARVVEGTDPDWSPDGTRLAFALDGDIYTISSDGSGERRVTASGLNSSPAWSPDGSKIAFTHIYDGSFASYEHDVRVVNANGGPEGRIASSSHDESDPAWSPNGDKVAYARHRRCSYCFGFDDAIFINNANGTGAQQLGYASTHRVANPDYTPDGTKIAYDTSGEIVTQKVMGGPDFQRVTTGTDPSWSPDGTKMIFTRGDLPGAMVIVRDSSGAEYDVASGTSPDWGKAPTR